MKPSNKLEIMRWVCSVLLVGMLAGLLPQAHAEKIIYVQRSNLRDTVKFINILQAQGHEVTIVDDSQGAADTAANYAAAGYGLLIADEVISSGNVGDRWRHSTIPVLNWEGFLYNDPRSDFNGGAAGTDMLGNTYADAAAAVAENGGAGADYGQINGSLDVTIVDATHPLAAGFPAGALAIWDSSSSNYVTTFVGTRTLISGAQVVATFPGFSGGATIMGVPEGAINADGTTNQARWVHLPWNDSEEVRAVSDDSLYLFEAAVAWALNKAEPTKLRNLALPSGSAQSTNVSISFSVDKVTAADSAVSSSDIHLTLNGVDVIGGANIVDGGGTWNVTYNGTVAQSQNFLVVASATAADGGFSARQSSFDTIDVNSLFTVEAEDFNFEGGMFFNNPAFCDTIGGCENSYFDRVGYTNIDKLELNFAVSSTLPASNEVYRFGDAFDTIRDEWVDTYITDDTLVRTKYENSGYPDYEVRNTAIDEWMNYTRNYPTGNFTVWLRVNSAAAMQVDLSMVEGDATTESQTATSLGKFIAPSGTGGGYSYVQLTDGTGETPIVVALTNTTPATLRLTAETAGFIPNFFYLLPSEEAPNLPPVATVTSPADFDSIDSGAMVSVDVTASDPDGSVTNVQVLVNGEVVGEDNTAPYSVTWEVPSFVGAQNYTIEAVAQDDGGLSGSDQVLVKAMGGLVVFTTDGVGGDAEVTENDNGDGGSGTKVNMNARINPTNRNELIVLKFDSGTNDLSSASAASINMISYRSLSASDLRVYAVMDGTAGLDNNGVTPGYTDNTWDQNGGAANVVYSTTPGLVWDGDSDSVRTYNNVVDLGVLNQGGNEGTVWSFSSVELLSFLQTNADNIVMFLVTSDTEESGQKRFAQSEATSLDSGDPVVPAGWYAPFLAIQIGGNTEPQVTITSPSDGATLDGGVEVTITADASDSDGTIASVDFYEGTTLLGSDNSAPYEQAWTPAAPNAVNSYTLSVIATDNGGATATNEISVTVVDPTLEIVGTTVGNGADSEFDEENEPTAAKPAATELNTRFMATTDGQNECVGLAFDLSGYTLSDLNNVTLNLINYRNNSARHIDVYGVAQGATSGSGAYTTETWTDSGGSAVVAWGDLPGLLASDGDQSTRSFNTAVITKLVSDYILQNLSEGTIEAVTSPELSAFVQGYSGSSRITLLIVAADGYTSSGQFRFASKESTSTSGGVLTGSAGDFAPFLSFTAGVLEPTLDYEITGGGSGIDFSWTGAFKLQAQTNSMNVGLSTNWFDYPGGGTGSVSVPVDDTQPGVFFRLAPQ